MKPDYQTPDGSVTLYRGDCTKVLAKLKKGAATVTLTDPPWAIGLKYDGYDDTKDNLQKLIDRFMPECRRICKKVLVMSGVSNVTMYPHPDWICAVAWNTTFSYGKYGFSQWTPVICYGNDTKKRSSGGIIQADVIRMDGTGFSRSADEKKHPCPKPSSMMRMVMARLTLESDVVLDPFLGSGSTAVAAIEAGRKFVGIEQSPKYFKVAVKRIEDALKQPRLFTGEQVLWSKRSPRPRLRL